MPVLRGGRGRGGRGRRVGGRGRRVEGWGTFLKLVKLLVEKFQKNTPKRYLRILPVVGVP